MREGAENYLAYNYELIDTTLAGLGPQDLPALLEDTERRGFSGLNITYPFKQRVIPFLTSLSPEAEAIGAVNTVMLRDGERIGHNTDWWGFSEAFRRGFPKEHYQSVVQLGAGGAGAATAYAILRLGAQRVAIYDINSDRSELLAADMQSKFPERLVTQSLDIAASLKNADGLVHATPTGMIGHAGLPLEADLLVPELWVAEVVYFPLETALLLEARRRGSRTLDGGGMAVFQAVEAFRLITGIIPDAARMLSHFRSLEAAGEVHLIEQRVGLNEKVQADPLR